MTQSKSQQRRSEAQSKSTESTKVEAAEAAEEPVAAEPTAPLGSEEVVPVGVQQFDPAPPPQPGLNVVMVTPSSNAQVTVPSGASFSLQPGVPVRMQQRDADFLRESGLAG